jgi:hypothetical protein
MTSSPNPQTEFVNPVVVYTAASNVEAHMIVKLLSTNDIPAYAVEDQSGVSLWAMGTISQFHQPRIWVEDASAEGAAKLIRVFEEKNQMRRQPGLGDNVIAVVCEGCGKTTSFPESQNGTTQDCGHCGCFVDVGDTDFDADLETAEESGQ